MYLINDEFVILGLVAVALLLSIQAVFVIKLNKSRLFISAMEMAIYTLGLSLLFSFVSTFFVAYSMFNDLADYLEFNEIVKNEHQVGFVFDPSLFSTWSILNLVSFIAPACVAVLMYLKRRCFDEKQQPDGP